MITTDLTLRLAARRSNSEIAAGLFSQSYSEKAVTSAGTDHHGRTIRLVRGRTKNRHSGLISGGIPDSSRGFLLPERDHRPGGRLTQKRTEKQGGSEHGITGFEATEEAARSIGRSI